jgi:DNA-binding NtrC family response regulator
VLKNYSWPGNVRELKNLAENLVVFHSSRKLSVSNLPEFLFERPAENPHIPMVFQRKRDDLEREIIYKTLLSIKEDINELKNILVRKFGYDTTVLLPLKDNFQEQNESDVIKPSEHVKPIADIEKDMVIKALNQFNWNKKKAAHALGIGERTLYRKIKEYGL